MEIKYLSKHEQEVAEAAMLKVASKYGLESQEAIDFCKSIEREVNNRHLIDFNVRVRSRLIQLGCF